MPGLLWNEYLPYFANLLFLLKYPGGRTAPVRLSGPKKARFVFQVVFFTFHTKEPRLIGISNLKQGQLLFHQV